MRANNTVAHGWTPPVKKHPKISSAGIRVDESLLTGTNVNDKLRSQPLRISVIDQGPFMPPTARGRSWRGNILSVLIVAIVAVICNLWLLNEARIYREEHIPPPPPSPFAPNPRLH